MAFGAIALAAIGGVIAILSTCMMSYVELTREISTVSAGELFEAGLTIVCVVGVFGLIMGGIGALVSKPPVAIALGAGAAAMAGVSIVINLLATMVSEYAQKAIELAQQPSDQIMSGSTLMITLLGEFGLLMGAAGLLAVPLAIGGVILLEALGVMGVSNKVIKEYAETALATIAMNAGSKVWKGGDLQMGTSLMIEMLKSFKEFMDSFDISIIKQRVYVNIYGSILGDVLELTKKLTEIAVYTKDNLTVEDVSLFNSVLIGAGLDDNKSMIGAMNNMITGIMDLGESIGWGIHLTKGLIAADSIMNVMSKFIDVIAKVSTLTYIMGYDSNGNPMFAKIKAEDFGKAADVTTVQFKAFIDKMIGGFDKVNVLSLVLSYTMNKTMKPVIDTLSKFVDIVMKVATSTYIIGYDEN